MRATISEEIRFIHFIGPFRGIEFEKRVLFRENRESIPVFRVYVSRKTIFIARHIRRHV